MQRIYQFSSNDLQIRLLIHKSLKTVIKVSEKKILIGGGGGGRQRNVSFDKYTNIIVAVKPFNENSFNIYLKKALIKVSQFNLHLKYLIKILTTLSEGNVTRIVFMKDCC